MSAASSIDEAKLEAFMGQAVTDMGAIISAPLFVIGEKLGLYKAMANAGPLSSEEVAERSGAAVREHVSEPRRREAEARYHANESIANVPIDTAIDQLIGPIYYRTVIIHAAVDGRLVDAVLDAVLTPNDGRNRHRDPSVNSYEAVRDSRCIS